MSYERLGNLYAGQRLGSFETFGQFLNPAAQAAAFDTMPAEMTDPTGGMPAAPQAAGGAVSGIASILGAVGSIGAQFYAAHTQAKLEEQALRARQRQPQPQQQGIDPALLAMLAQPRQQQQSNLPIILGVVGILGLGILFVVMRKKK